MRWELEGAQATLSLRAVYVNGLWDQFIAYRVATEQKRLYGKYTAACNGCIKAAGELLPSNRRCRCHTRRPTADRVDHVRCR